MQYARVEGSVISTRKHPSFEGWRLVICQPLNALGDAEGVPLIALDSHGAGMHQKVIITSDGIAARKAVGDNFSPARMMILGIVDDPKIFESKTDNGN